MKLMVSVLIVFFASSIAYSQLPSKVKKLEGKWEYKLGSGFEVLEIVGDELVGVGYRINQKTNDTTSVENTNIQVVNNVLIYSLTTYNVIGDSITKTVQKFVSEGKKLKFRNVTSSTPYSIHFTSGFLHRNKLKISIYHGPNENPIHLYLNRQSTN
jgi:hypothetical protein